ncbi:MAG: hypothetical protein NT007_07095 [Candidatus Kapabacteria bacterium]|nr:hypothetical protein [Candidatus Kapabacteria bacterium]
MKQKKINLLLILNFLIVNVSFAQWDAEASFKTELTSSLLNERGYSKNNKPDAKDKLNISPINGNVLYTYPLHNYSSFGTPMNVTLTYNGSVDFTCFSNEYFGDNGVKHWNSIRRNRPAWIIGVNGFAVQVLSQTSSYFLDPGINERSKNPNLTNEQNHSATFTDEDYIWAINGYDYCNSMREVDNLPYETFQDRIHILKSDGSVLELVNSRYYAYHHYTENNSSCENKSMEFYYQGKYFENTINSKGYAIVSYDNNSQNLYGELEFNCQLNFNSFESVSVYNDKVFKPRTLRYFPGDGFEYVFYEDIYPYGYNMSFVGSYGDAIFHNQVIPNQIPLNSSLGIYKWGLVQNSITWQNKLGLNIIPPWGSPTIFYLKYIIDKDGRIINDFEYSFNIIKGNQLSSVDEYKNYLQNKQSGRRALTSFIDCDLSINLKGMSINFKNENKHIELDWSEKGSYGNSKNNDLNFSSRSGFFLNKNGEPLPSDGRLIPCHPNTFASIVNYVRTITETQNEKRIAFTEFDYERYQTVYHPSIQNNGAMLFPISFWFDGIERIGYDSRIALSDLRLVKIIEEADERAFTYYKCNYTSVPIIGDEDFTPLFWFFHNMTLSVIKKDHYENEAYTRNFNFSFRAGDFVNGALPAYSSEYITKGSNYFGKKIEHVYENIVACNWTNSKRDCDPILANIHTYLKSKITTNGFGNNTIQYIEQNDVQPYFNGVPIERSAAPPIFVYDFKAGYESQCGVISNDKVSQLFFGVYPEMWTAS